MANGWAHDGAVQDQIDATIQDGVNRARNQLATAAASLTHCEECGEKIPLARQRAIAGVHLCVKCQTLADQQQENYAGYNRRGSKDSQLR